MASTFDLSVLLKMVDRFSNPIKQAMQNFNNFSDQVKKTDSAMIQFGNRTKEIGQSLSKYVTLPLTVAGGYAAKTAIGFEDAWIGVLKTVDESEEVLAGLKKELMDIPKGIPLLQEEIFGLAESAGQLAIKAKNIPQFVKVMANLAATTNITTDQAQDLAQFANVMNMPQEAFQNLGSSISYLGNNLATNEREILNMSTRLSGMGSLMKMTPAQVMGIAGALAQLGIPAERGGSAFSRLMAMINSEVGTGSKNMQMFAKIAGISIKDFEKLWKENATDAMLQFSAGFTRLEKEGKNVSGILDALGMDGIGTAEVLLKMASAQDKVREAVEFSSHAWERGDYTLKEAELRYGTTGSQLKLLWNDVRELANAFGESLVPAIRSVVDILRPLIEWFIELNPIVKRIIVVFLALVAAIGPLIMAFGAIVAAIGFIVANAAVAGVIAGITAAFAILATTVALVVEYFEQIKEFFTNIPNLIKGFANVAEKAALSIKDKIKGAIPDFVANWLNKGSSGEEGPGNASILERASIGQVQPVNNNSKTEVVIKVASEEGSSATVEGVNKKGQANVNVFNEAHLGYGAAWGTP